jgi:hypothetical protein
MHPKSKVDFHDGFEISLDKLRGRWLGSEGLLLPNFLQFLQVQTLPTEAGYPHGKQQGAIHLNGTALHYHPPQAPMQLALRRGSQRLGAIE